MTDIIEERGEYRAVVEHDQHPSEPDNESGFPVLRIDEWNRIGDTGYGGASAKASGISAKAALAHFLAGNGNTADAVDVFDRWLRIFHGGGAVGYHLGYSREYGYVAYSTRAMVFDGWGHTEESLAAALVTHPDLLTPELNEWEAYCEGDVYLVSVERKVLKRIEYVTIDEGHHPLMSGEQEDWIDEEGPVGGFYGYEYAVEAAREMLDEVAPKTEVPA